MTSGLRALVTATVLAAWIGAAVLLASVVAPAAFAVLPSRALAGNVIGRVLPVIFLSGIGAGLAVAALAVGAPGARLRAGLGLTIAAACAIAQFVIGPRIARLRDQIGGAIDTLPIDDVQRIAFGRLHGISVLWMGVAVLAAGTLLVLTLWSARARP